MEWLEKLNKSIEYIEDNLDGEINIDKAAIDLQNGEKVIDVSIKYGYESPTSFNRAFKKVHQVSPSIARKKGTFLKSYSPISFKLIIKGVEEMEYRIEKKEAFRVVGVGMKLVNDFEENSLKVPKLWQESGENGKLQKLISLKLQINLY